MMRYGFSFLLGAAFVGVAVAQPATPAQRAGVTAQPGFATMHLEAMLGSFKMIDGQGRVEFSFEGTVLLSQIKGQRQVTGNVQRKYNAEGREVWFGRGRVVVTGSWRAIQWFGKDMRLVWFGQGVVRLSGEYYRDPVTRELRTGKMWYDNPAEIVDWPAQGSIDQRLPRYEAPKPIEPRRRQG